MSVFRCRDDMKKENAPAERDASKELERILHENFSEEELGPGVCESDKSLEEVEGEAVDNVARFLKRVNDKMHS